MKTEGNSVVNWVVERHTDHFCIDIDKKTGCRIYLIANSEAFYFLNGQRVEPEVFRAILPEHYARVTGEMNGTPTAQAASANTRE